MWKIKILFPAILVIVFAGIATPTQAISLTESQIQAIISLLSSFGADASVTNNVNASLRGIATTNTATVPSNSPTFRGIATTNTATVATNSPTCLILNNNLYLDSTDTTSEGEVSKLQQFLGGRVTGYFGPATLQLVQNWQASNGVVSSGSPDTTGFGSVGPKTRSQLGCSTRFNESSNTPSRLVAPPDLTNEIIPTKGMCPAVIPPNCDTGTLVSLGTDANGCNKGYQCQSSPAVSCAVSAKPYMPAVGEYTTLSWSSQNASSLLWQQDTAANLLGLPSGALSSSGFKSFQVGGKGGPMTVTLLAQGLNGKSTSCTTTLSVENTGSACPVLSPIICSTGTLISLGKDANGCNKGYQCSVNEKTPTLSFSVYPTSIVEGESAVLKWSSTDANRCGLQYGSTEENIPLNGTKTIEPSQSTSYYVWCTNDPGNGKDGPSIRKNVTLNVDSKKMSIGVVAVGVYEGSYPSGVRHSYNYHPEGTINVNVSGDTGQNRDLVLTSYEPVNWVLTVQNGVLINKIIVSGYHLSRVTNVPSGTQVEYHSLSTNGKYNYSYQSSGQEYESLKQWLTGLYRAPDGELDGNFMFPGYSASSINVYVGYKG